MASTSIPDSPQSRWFFSYLPRLEAYNEMVRSFRSEKIEDRMKRILWLIYSDPDGEAWRGKLLKMFVHNPGEGEAGLFEIQFKRIIDALLKSGLIEEFKRIDYYPRSDPNKKKMNTYYRMRKDWISYPKTEMPWDSIMILKLQAAMKLGIEAYEAMGRTKEEFLNEYRFRTTWEKLWLEEDLPTKNEDILY